MSEATFHGQIILEKPLAGPFCIFGYLEFYPNGGMGDYLCTRADLESAIAAAEIKCRYHNFDAVDVAMMMPGELLLIAKLERKGDEWHWREVGK